MRKSTENYISKTTKEGSTITNTLHFVYDNYTHIQALNESNQSTQEFVWDPTAGQATKPLYMRVPQTGSNLLYLHDANKNVTELALFATQNGIGAHYEYSPFGETIVSTKNTPVISQDFRTYNPFRFSSEYHDDELALIYYNYRHYNPTSGRWLSRDPIAEKGGFNLYNFVKNTPVNFGDILGKYSTCPKNKKLNFIKSEYKDLKLISTYEYRTSEPNGVKSEPNGCSNPLPMFGVWNDFFKSACDRHDQCYDTCGYAKRDCERQFYDLMVDLCMSEMSVMGVPACMVIAMVYHDVVSIASSYYEDAQDNVCKKATCEECRYYPGSTPDLRCGG